MRKFAGWSLLVLALVAGVVVMTSRTTNDVGDARDVVEAQPSVDRGPQCPERATYLGGDLCEMISQPETVTRCHADWVIAADVCLQGVTPASLNTGMRLCPNGSTASGSDCLIDLGELEGCPETHKFPSGEHKCVTRTASDQSGERCPDGAGGEVNRCWIRVSDARFAFCEQDQLRRSLECLNVVGEPSAAEDQRRCITGELYRDRCVAAVSCDGDEVVLFNLCLERKVFDPGQCVEERCPVVIEGNMTLADGRLQCDGECGIGGPALATAGPNGSFRCLTGSILFYSSNQKWGTCRQPVRNEPACTEFGSTKAGSGCVKPVDVHCVEGQLRSGRCYSVVEGLLVVQCDSAPELAASYTMCVSVLPVVITRCPGDSVETSAGCASVVAARCAERTVVGGRCIES